MKKSSDTIGNLTRDLPVCSAVPQPPHLHVPEVTGEWRKLHNEELHDLYSSPNIVRVIKSRRLRWVGHVAWMRKERGMYRVSVGKTERRRSLVRPRRRWEDNIRMDLQEVGCGGMDWIGLAQDTDRWRATVNTVIKRGEFLD
jgi:hypothetical protein